MAPLGSMDRRDGREVVGDARREPLFCDTYLDAVKVLGVSDDGHKSWTWMQLGGHMALQASMTIVGSLVFLISWLLAGASHPADVDVKAVFERMKPSVFNAVTVFALATNWAPFSRKPKLVPILIASLMVVARAATPWLLEVTVPGLCHGPFAPLCSHIIGPFGIGGFISTLGCAYASMINRQLFSWRALRTCWRDFILDVIAGALGVFCLLLLTVYPIFDTYYRPDLTRSYPWYNLVRPLVMIAVSLLGNSGYQVMANRYGTTWKLAVVWLTGAQTGMVFVLGISTSRTILQFVCVIATYDLYHAVDTVLILWRGDLGWFSAAQDIKHRAANRGHRNSGVRQLAERQEPGYEEFDHERPQQVELGSQQALEPAVATGVAALSVSAPPAAPGNSALLLDGRGVELVRASSSSSDVAEGGVRRAESPAEISFLSGLNFDLEAPEGVPHAAMCSYVLSVKAAAENMAFTALISLYAVAHTGVIELHKDMLEHLAFPCQFAITFVYVAAVNSVVVRAIQQRLLALKSSRWHFRCGCSMPFRTPYKLKALEVWFIPLCASFFALYLPVSFGWLKPDSTRCIV